MTNTHTFLTHLSTPTLNKIHKILLDDIVDGRQPKQSGQLMAAHITAILNRRQSPSYTPTIRELEAVAA